MGKRRKESASEDGGSPAPKRAKSDAGMIVFSTPELLALILAHVINIFSDRALVYAVAIGSLGLKSRLGGSGILASNYLAECVVLGRFLVLFSTVCIRALAAARSVRLPAQCGFHMRRDIQSHQFRAFLQGWKPELTNNSVTLEVYHGCALVSLRSEIDYCTVNNIELVLKRHLNCGIFEPAYLSISFVREGVLAYHQKDYKTATPILIKASRFFYDEYTTLLSNIMDDGRWDCHYDDVYAKLALRWLRMRENQDLSRDERRIAQNEPTGPHTPDMTLPPRLHNLIKESRRPVG